MSNDEGPYAYIIAARDFDTSRLPLDARQPGTDAFRKAVGDLLADGFKGFGGTATISVSADLIQVTWRAGTTPLDPVMQAAEKLTHGEYREGIRMLRVLQGVSPENVGILYNLGMALSDMGELTEAEQHLRRLVALEPGHTNGWVALGVALARQGRPDDAVQTLRRAVEVSPDNPWAQRNLGRVLMQLGKMADAKGHLQRAVELNPDDPQAAFGLGQVLEAEGELGEADRLYKKAIDLSPDGPAAEAAKEARSGLAHRTFRGAVGGLRPDAVMYLLGAIQKFEAMPRQQVQQVGFEIAILGQRGIDPNDSTRKYTLRSLPGEFTGLHLLCLMHAAFRIIAPEQSIAFDLSKEYAAAQALHRKTDEKS